MADQDLTTGANTDLQRLSDSGDFDVAEGYPDIRGWDVKTADGTKIGTVDDLIVSISEMRVRYVDVEVDRSMRNAVEEGGTEDAHLLLPIGAVELDDDNDDVVATGLGGPLDAYPRYGGRDISLGYEQSLRDRFRGGSEMTGIGAGLGGMAATGSRDFYDHEHYDDQRAFAKRRPTRTVDGDETLVRSEEQLAVGKRSVPAGEVTVSKTVETERVSEEVPLSHDEVTIERRPLTGMSTEGATIGDQEIRVPLMREEPVVSKQAVVREEIIIRKQRKTENRTVEADLRRERINVEGSPGTTEQSGR
ncbi:MAG: DUF2382 domain-containing protein [Gemmatimonadaceae bacterium]|jgi:uncharacterized protein (TIGR02271 family)|nr:DUF2382 domain-containing protein [Gemmatimonadaceae bacterium]